MSNACEVTGYGDVDHVFELAIQGDRAAADQAFAACIARFERVLARFVYNVEDREDALQDGLLNAYRHLSQFQGKSQFTTWIHTIVVNAALASASAGNPSLLPRAASEVLRLGPSGVYRYLRDSRIVERVAPRMRAKLSGTF